MGLKPTAKHACENTQTHRHTHMMADASNRRWDELSSYST